MIADKNGLPLVFFFQYTGMDQSRSFIAGPDRGLSPFVRKKKIQASLDSWYSTLLSGMVKTGGLFTLIGKRQSAAPAEKPEENKYSVCSKFPDSSGPEIVFDEELRVHLMDG